MQIDLDQNEIKKLLVALGMYQVHSKMQKEECSEEDKLLTTLKEDDKFSQELRDKLKIAQMKFPCEEHMCLFLGMRRQNGKMQPEKMVEEESDVEP